tara:strand:+ start:69 stop:476 length:408 start_codon:yes stop_codon:yes gene_type:complete
MSKGVNFLLYEKNDKNIKKEIPTYEELVNEVNKLNDECNDINLDDINPSDVDFDENDIIALQLHYQTNYTKKDLEKIAEYYKINKRQKKIELIDELVEFENDFCNREIVLKRKRLWNYIEEIKNDKYLSRYLIFD